MFVISTELLHVNNSAVIQCYMMVSIVGAQMKADAQLWYCSFV